MKIFSVFVFTLFIQFNLVVAQSNKMDKKMEKVYELVDKGKFKDAGDQLEKILDESPDYGSGWDYLSKIRYKEYTDSKASDNILGNGISITTTDKDGNEIKNDTLAQKLIELLNSVKPSKVAYSKYKYTMRKALLTSTDAYYCSFMLRNLFVDVEIDTAVSKKALKYFYEAEDEFSKKNYNKASKLYKRALDEQPNFYKASLYMGDCFFFLENYTNAISSFKSAIEKFPFLIEPRKYLIDAYAKEHLYEEALNEAIAATTVYPDLSLMTKLEDAAYLNNKKVDFKWTPRMVLPNKIIDSTKKTTNEYTDKDAKEPTAPWAFYQNAQKSIEKYCNNKGLIVTENSLTQSKYLELYSWEEMLKNSNDNSLNEAKRMQKEGYLDCYVMVSCFHFDFYDQYLDFVTKNKQRVIDYYNKYIIPN